VPVALDIFTEVLGTKKNQLDVARLDVQVSAADLLAVPEGTRTEAGLRHNIRVGIHYLAAWLAGNGCVPLYDLMEDAATAEICRSQVWQWRHNKVKVTMHDGRSEALTDAVLLNMTAEEYAAIRIEVGDEMFVAGRYHDAREMFVRLSTAREFVEFLTIPAYPLLNTP
jgi:malate synthase